MRCQAESERYLNVVSVVHRGGKANIRLADNIVSDNGVVIAMGELRRRRQERLAGFRSATAIEDMFSVCDKSRPDSPTRNAYRSIRGGRVVRGVLRSWDFEDGKVAESSTKRPDAESLKQIRSSRARPGRPSAAGRRVAQGGPYLRRRRRIPAALAVRPAGARPHGLCPRPASMPAVFLIPQTGRIFPTLRET